jgi:hypothetical protein
MSSGPFKIGLNETQLGIAAPLWFAETMTAIVGQRQTEKLLQVCSCAAVSRHFMQRDAFEFYAACISFFFFSFHFHSRRPFFS